LFSSIFPNVPSAAGISSFFDLSVSMNRLTIMGENGISCCPTHDGHPILFLFQCKCFSQSAVCLTTGPQPLLNASSVHNAVC
jgi:hypothetical protein